MKMKEDPQAVYEEVCRVIGRAVVMLMESKQVVNNNTINLMLQAHADQADDAYLKKIYRVARNVMG